MFKIDTNGVESTLYSFTDGSEPMRSFSIDSAGNVFGTAAAQDGSGFVFEVTPSGQESVLQTFSSSTFNVGLVMDKAGSLYGVDEWEWRIGRAERFSLGRCLERCCLRSELLGESVEHPLKLRDLDFQLTPRRTAGERKLAPQ